MGLQDRIDRRIRTLEARRRGVDENSLPLPVRIQHQTWWSELRQRRDGEASWSRLAVGVLLCVLVGAPLLYLLSLIVSVPFA